MVMGIVAGKSDGPQQLTIFHFAGSVGITTNFCYVVHRLLIFLSLHVRLRRGILCRCLSDGWDSIIPCQRYFLAGAGGLIFALYPSYRKPGPGTIGMFFIAVSFETAGSYLDLEAGNWVLLLQAGRGRRASMADV